MHGLIPNVIELPYGRAPPLYIKAPNWHRMLQLMAMLSRTSLQPPKAVAKTLHLRVVVAFVPVYPASIEKVAPP